MTTETTSLNILEAVLGINTSANLNNFNIRGYSLTVDNGGISEISSGFVNAGEFLTLPPTSGVTGFDVVSTSTADTNSAGTGARQIVVTYSAMDGTKSSSTVNMNGTTPVVVSGLTASTCVRFISAIVISVGSGNENAGRITIYQTSTSANIYEQINAGNNISASARGFIPETMSFYPRFLNMNKFSSALDDLEIYLQIKTTDNDIWKNFQKLFLNGSNEAEMQWELVGLVLSPSLVNGTASTGGIDIRFVGQLLSSGPTAGASINLNGYYK